MAKKVNICNFVNVFLNREKEKKSQIGKGFNAAVSGAESNDMPTQAARLVQRFRESKDIDFDNDWKLITIFIGGNDLCRYAKDKELHSPQRYIDEIAAAIDLLYKELPRAFINLASSIDASQVKDLNIGKDY